MSFDLLQTLRLEDGRCRHLDAHLQRMAVAAAHFGRPWPGDEARRALDALAQACPLGVWRVRLLLDAQSRVSAQVHAFADVAAPVRVRLAAAPLRVDDMDFVRFKTTRRAHYDAFAPADAAVFDTLLWNERRELTEFTRGSVAVRIGGRWLTPPLHCGLLDGVGRRVALDGGEVEEAVIPLADLERAEGLAFVNSLRGWLTATLVR